jgi:hypothetical protein
MGCDDDESVKSRVFVEFAFARSQPSRGCRAAP